MDNSSITKNISIQDLIESPESYVSYNASKFLNAEIASTEALRNKMLCDSRIINMISELQSWPGTVISSHKSANQFFHKLVFLSDLGITIKDPGISDIITKILSHIDSNSIPCIQMEIATAYGGSGEPQEGWALCDAPNILYALKRMNCVDDVIDLSVEYLAGLMDAEGYSCHVSAALGNWRGPGKKSDPCPYATLIMLKLLLLYGDKYHRQISNCTECLLGLWERSRTRHPYIFYMGDDFRKLKLPFIWYDIVHVVDVLSCVKEIQNDSRFLEMYSKINEKRSPAGYTPQSAYQAFKLWDFGQKSRVSDWLTFCILRISERVGQPED